MEAAVELSGRNAVDDNDTRRAEHPDWWEELTRMMTQTIERTVEARLNAEREQLRRDIVRDIAFQMSSTEVNDIIRQAIQSKLYVLVTVKE